jgi:hypothetical protein
MTSPDETIDRDLEAVEAALLTGRAAHDEPAARDLQELVLTLAAEAAEAPPPREEFAEELRDRVEEGFPGPTRAQRGRRSLAVLLHDFAPVVGLAATILLVVGVVLVAGGSSGSNDDGASGGSSGGGAEAAKPAPASGGGSGASGDQSTLAVDKGATRGAPQLKKFSPSGLVPLTGNFAPNQLNRRIERSYSMELSVPVKEMSRVADRVTSVAYRHGGFVLSSSVDTGTEGGGGDFSLRIPTSQLRAALRDLAELAPVTSQSQEGRDVTRQHVTATDRLQAARAERRSLLRRLEEATTDAEAEAIRRQLDLVAGEINGLRAQLRNLRLRTNYAVVDVTLAQAKQDDGQLGSLGDSFDDAGDLLAGFAGVTIRVMALALPLGLIALVAWLAARTLRRRRRESALA